jgi:hypothetical protein
MRTAVLSYFLVVGTILFGVLTLVSNRLAPMALQNVANGRHTSAF